MKRFIVMINLFTLTTVAAFAQSNNDLYHRKATRKDILQQQQSRNSASKPTTEKSRIIASSKYMQGVINDSVRNYYSGTRGSDIDNPMDNMAAATSVFLPGFEKQLNKCDSFQEWGLVENSPTILPVFNSSFQYDNAQRPTQITMGILTFSTQYDLFYNAAGKLQQWDQQGTTGGPTDIRNYRKYDGQGRKTLDSAFDITYTNSPSNKTTYHYDNDGNLSADSAYQWVSGAWSLYATSRYIYDPQDRLELVSYKDMESGSGTLDNAIRISYLYAGTNPYPAEELRQLWENNAWADDEKTRITFNSGGKPTTIIHAFRVAANTLDTAEKREISYNAKGLITKEQFYAYQNGAYETTPYRADNWYYETYNDGNSTGIDHVHLAEDAINLYPIPAQDVVYVITKKGTKLSRIQLYNSAGRLIKAFDGNSKSDLSFSVTDLPQGLYFVKSFTDKGTCAHRISIQH